jgi:hypothetical protein
MPSALVHGVRMTTLTLGISTSANYGDPECLANPRCADLFKDPKYWGSSDFYGIGGSEQVRLSLGTIRVSGKSHTLFVGLDAEGHTQLASHVLRRVRRVGVRRRVAYVRVEVSREFERPEDRRPLRRVRAFQLFEQLVDVVAAGGLAQPARETDEEQWVGEKRSPGVGGFVWGLIALVTRRRRHKRKEVTMATTRTKEQLYREAKRLGVRGRSKMNKGQLQAAIARRGR